MSAKTIARWMWIPVILTFAYAGWVLYIRRAENRRLVEEAEQSRAAEDRKVLEKLGSGNLKVLLFYANPPIVRRGDRTLLCYGVANAKNVRIEPGVAGVGPAISRCVEAAPKADTTYTLIADDGAGNETKSTVEVKVQN